MNVLTRMVAAMLRRSMALMPASRREWTEAVWAETAEIPPGWGQLSWLAGGVRLAVREAALARGLRYPVAFAAAAAGLAWSAWSGPPGDSAIARNRVEVTAIAVILGGLPWLIRRARGPTGGGGLTRLVRAGGYAAVLALVLTRTALQRVADAPPNNRTASAAAWIVEIIFLAVLTGYAAVILAYTARRSPVVPSALALGTAVGAALGIVAYALGPLGFPLRFTGRWPALAYDAAMGAGVLLALCAPVAAGRAAARRAGRSRPAGTAAGHGGSRAAQGGSRAGQGGSRAGQGAMAGLCTGAAAALVVAVLSTTTIALLPHDPRLRNWAAGHIGHWTPAAGEWTPVLSQGARTGYVPGASAFATGFLVVLVIGPLAGWLLGAWGARGRRGRGSTPTAAAARR